jgi:hypothetical protein
MNTNPRISRIDPGVKELLALCRKHALGQAKFDAQKTGRSGNGNDYVQRRRYEQPSGC